MSSNGMMMPNSNSNNSQVNEVLCTPTFVIPAFPSLDGRQTLSSFVQIPVCNQNQTQQQPIIKFTKTQQKNQIKQETTQAQIVSSTLSPALTDTIAIPTSALQQQHQQIQNSHIIQNGQKFSNTAIMIPSNSSQTKSNQMNNIVNDVIWSCPSCKLPCKTASEFQTHLSVHTKTEKSVPCEQCGKLFASAERVRIHVKVAHGTKSSTCHLCGSSFSYKCKLADHMRTHTGDKPFQCDVCGRKFSQKNHVRRHKMIHTGEKPFLCDICGKGFYRKDKLSRHRLIHTNPSSRKNKQSQLNNNENNSSNNHINNVTNGSLISNELISTNALSNNNSIFQSNGTNDNIFSSNTQPFVTSPGGTTIQLIPVQLAAQQWIAAQNNINNNHQEQESINNSSNNSNVTNSNCS